ncbi:hypothetical protein [Streptomyces werraensis]|uniref:hypothetical protein n=1 Tax=Streptomyces werraensis TaxID=68284 RepID=UPI0034200327
MSVSHSGPQFQEVITVRAESGPVTLTWSQAKEITRRVELIACARRGRETFRAARLTRVAREELAKLNLTLAEGRAVRDYYLDHFYDVRIPMRCHW